MAKHSLPSGHKAKKRFGQNFLIDQGIIQHIIRSISPKATDNLVEIGPGQGAITGLLLEKCSKLNVIELDKDLIPVLLAQFAKFDDLTIHQTDALKFDYSRLTQDGASPLRIVGNLPYNISTPLIFHLIEFQSHILDMHFMLQKEVVQRLAANTNDKHYGRLGIIAQYFCQIEHLFDVPPESFHPAPKVDSAIVRLTPHKSKPFEAIAFSDFELLVKSAFSQRRKTLKNALKSTFDEKLLASLPIDLTRRAETVSLEEFVNLANLITEQQT